MSETPSENGPVEPARHLLADNGVVPNSALPALVYKQAAPQRSDLDDWFRTTFAENRWVGARDDMLSDTDHYHSTAFAVFGVVSGSGEVALGGSGAVEIALNARDVVVLPAGVSCRRVSGDLRVISAFFEEPHPDTLTVEPVEHDAAAERINNVSPPDVDPIYGDNGPLDRIYG